MKPNPRSLIFAVGGLALAHFVTLPAAYGALHTWDGEGANSLWMNATNWVGDVAPVPGDDLFFPVAPPNLFPANNFPAGTTFNSLIFAGGGYTLGGSTLALNAGILVTNEANNYINNSLVLNSNQTFTLNAGSASFSMYGAINNNGYDLTFSPGAGTLAQIQSIISGSGGLIKTGAGTVLLYASNTFSGPLQINQGSVSIYYPAALGSTNGSTTIATGASLSVNTAATLAEPFIISGTLSSAGSGAKIVVGPITLGAGSPTIGVVADTPLTLNTVITGSNGFTKTLPGVLTLNSNNTYPGTTTIDGGTLVVNGSQPSSPILLNAGTLSGNGTVGTITTSGSSAKTLQSGAGPGILISSNLTLSSSTTLAVELNGTTPGPGHDQLKVNGSVTLNSARLTLTLGFASAISNSFTIIDNDGADAVTGTFNGLPEGATVNVNGTPFRISYAGGNGNDVVLTQLTAVQRPLLDIQLSAQTNVVLSWSTNFTTYNLEANSNMNSNVWTFVATPINIRGTNNVVTNTASGNQRYYRLKSP